MFVVEQPKPFDQRRFVSFLLLTLGVFLLSNMLFPPPPPAKKGAADGAKNEAAAPANDDVAKDDEKVTGTKTAADKVEAAAAPLANQLAAGDVPTQFLTIGSLDPDSGYRMLVTVTNTGAALHRTELSSPRYRDQDNRSGYLGALALKNVSGGAEVQVVGAGTPAAAAGVTVGDVIVGITHGQKEAKVATAKDFTKTLSTTVPGQEVVLKVKRGEGAPQSLTVKLMRHPFALLRPEIENFEMRGAELPADFVDRPSFLVSLAMLGGKRLEGDEAKQIAKALESTNWEVANHSDTSVEFTCRLADSGLTLVKRYSIERVPADELKNVTYPGYHVQLDIELRNNGTTTQSLAYRLDGPTGMPLDGWWFAHKISQRWFSAAGLRDVAVRFEGSRGLQIDCSQIAKGDVDPMGQGKSLAYGGVDGQYFSAVVMPIKKSLSEVWFDTTEATPVGAPLDERTPTTFTNVTTRMTRLPVELAAGASHIDSFKIFMGPKRPALLEQYQAAGDPSYSLHDLIYYGWPIFGAVARAMLSVLHFFYSILGNYGIAIIMLTVLVRGLMFPISYKQTLNMARMQALKPEMTRISEKYKNDMQKRSQEMQELYRKHKINPLGGCLPVFIQLPIFIGLYRALSVDVELRGSALFSSAIQWCSNLAAPDMFLNWSSVMPDFINSGQGMFSLGPYLNILPIVTVCLFLVTQKMAMPVPDSEQAELQQKMMKYMTGFMGLMFYKVASGLCLYFIASSLWGIAERKLLPKTKAAEGAVASGATNGASGGPSTRATSPSSSGPRPGQNGSSGKKSRDKPKHKR